MRCKQADSIATVSSPVSSLVLDFSSPKMFNDDISFSSALRIFTSRVRYGWKKGVRGEEGYWERGMFQKAEGTSVRRGGGGGWGVGFVSLINGVVYCKYL
jgi:hypothetical protein